MRQQKRVTMTLIWGLSFVIMAALSAKGAGEDSGLKMTCPSIPQAEPSETYCTVNITRIMEMNCDYQGKYIKISDNVRLRYSEITTIFCSIDVLTGECLHDVTYCPHCHTYGGVETRVYFTKTTYDSRHVSCVADCIRNESIVASWPCSPDPPKLAVVTTKGTQDPSEIVRTVCPFYVTKFPFSLGCRLSFWTLNRMNCMGTPFDPQVHVSQILELGAGRNKSFSTCLVGPFRGQKCAVFRGSCWCNLKRAADRNLREVFFDYGVNFAQYGSFTARCFVHCPTGLVMSQSFCQTTYTMPAYPYVVSAPQRRPALEILCPSLIPKIPFTVFCKVDVAKLEEDYCLKHGVGEHEVVMSRFLNKSGTPVESVTCRIANMPGVSHLCYTTPQCPFCRQQGKNQFLVSLPYNRSVGSVHETYSCRTGCYEFDEVSNECGVLYTPENGHT